MRKLVLLVALSVATLIGTAAQAATVNITATETAPGIWSVSYTSLINLGFMNWAIGNVSATVPTINAGLAGIDTGFSSCQYQLLNLTSWSCGISEGLLGSPLLPAGGVMASGFVSLGGPVVLTPDTANLGDVGADTPGNLPQTFAFFIVPLPLPEPGVAVLMGLALGGLAFLRRRSS